MTEFIPAVDAHHHLWDSIRHSYPYLTDGSRDRMHGKPLPRVYSIDDYSRDIAGLNIVRSVHIQCGWNPADPVGETRWLDGIAQQTGYPTAIVAHADLSDSAVERMLAAHAAASPRLRGIRQHVGWHDDPRYRLAGRRDLLRDPDWRRGFALLNKYNLSFDLQAFYPQFSDAADLAGQFPDTTSFWAIPACRSIVSPAPSPAGAEACNNSQPARTSMPRSAASLWSIITGPRTRLVRLSAT